MPIVSHTIESSTQANGSTNNVLRMYDQDGTEYTQVFNAPAGFAIQTKIDNTIVGMNEQLAESEFHALVGL
jgi:hypothetical protein